MARLTSLAVAAFAVMLAGATAPAKAPAPSASKLPSVPSVPSVPGIDAPQLAKLGSHKVGFRTLTLLHKDQPNLLGADPATGQVPLHTRTLKVDLWYPAKASSGAAMMTYSASLFGEPPRPAVRFTIPGMAISNAAPAGGGYPLVILSHGYSNSPAVMSWLTENLASKGYVVAAIHHEDPNPYIIAAPLRAAPNYNRPVDIAFAAGALRQQLGALIDPTQLALIGYSQGGYGVLTAGGASLDPAGPSMDLVAGGWMKRIARGAPQEALGKVPGVKAIIAIAPAGGLPRSAWGAQGLLDIKAPLLLIHGDADPVVDYKTGALAVFGGAKNSERYLLTYRQAGHSIALNPAPVEMRSSLWDLDWFEDPIWRQDRVNGINQHFITAFLELHLRGQSGMRGFLDVPIEESSEGTWDALPGTPWGAYSPGGAGITLWKGFQRRHAQGLVLRRAAAGQ